MLFDLFIYYIWRLDISITVIIFVLSYLSIVFESL